MNPVSLLQHSDPDSVPLSFLRGTGGSPIFADQMLDSIQVAPRLVPVLKDGTLDSRGQFPTDNLIATPFISSSTKMFLPWVVSTPLDWSQEISISMDLFPSGSEAVCSPTGSYWIAMPHHPGFDTIDLVDRGRKVTGTVRPALSSGLGLLVIPSMDDVGIGWKVRAQNLDGPWMPAIRLFYDKSMVRIIQTDLQLTISIRSGAKQGTLQLDPYKYALIEDFCKSVQEASSGLVTAVAMTPPMSRSSTLHLYDEDTQLVYIRALGVTNYDEPADTKYDPSTGRLSLAVPSQAGIDSVSGLPYFVSSTGPTYQKVTIAARIISSGLASVQRKLSSTPWIGYPVLLDTAGNRHQATALSDGTLHSLDPVGSASLAEGYCDGRLTLYDGYLSPETGQYDKLSMEMFSNGWAALVFGLPTHVVVDGTAVEVEYPVRHIWFRPGNSSEAIDSIVAGTSLACRTAVTESSLSGVPLLTLYPGSTTSIVKDVRRRSSPVSISSLRTREDLLDEGYYEGKFLPTAHTYLFLRGKDCSPLSSPVEEAKAIFPFGSYYVDVPYRDPNS